MRLTLLYFIALAGICHAAPFADPSLPFLFSTVDARDFGEHPQKDNLTVRGLCLKLDDGYSACYDTDLMRLSLVWKDGFLTEKGVAGLSYAANKKAGGGQKDLPKPIGKSILANDLVPGWLPADAQIEDSRTRSHNPKELGRGPMDPAIARYTDFGDSREYKAIAFELFGARWSEFIQADRFGVLRSIHGKVLAKPVKLVLGSFENATVTINQNVAIVKQAGQADLHFANIEHSRKYPEHVQGTFKWEQHRYLTLHLPARDKETDVLIGMGYDGAYPDLAAWDLDQRRPPPSEQRWPEAIKTDIHEVERAHGYVVESIALPAANPWNRRVRVSGVAPHPDGGLYVVTFDGDIWQVNLDEADPVWTRFAGGLHEPQSIQVDRHGNVFVFTRTGIIKVSHHSPRTMNYQCLSNLPAQTAETREFPMDMVIDPKPQRKIVPGFYLAKGGQNASGKLNGTIVHVSRDGKTMERIATGLRQPYLGIHPKTGMLTATDQQGNYVPSTPVHMIWAGKFYGYREAGHGLEDGKIQEPACWIPHKVAASGAGMVWALDERFGPLNGRLLMLDFNKAMISQIFIDPDYGSSAAAHRLPFIFPAPLLKACMHPKDGALYLGGFKVWGSVAPKWSGLYRLRYVGDEPSPWPTHVKAYKEGLHLTFSQPLDDTALELSNFRIKVWNYLRSSKYGSGYYKMDKSAGQEDRWASAVRRSEDRCSIFIVIPGLHPVDQLELDYTLKSAEGTVINDQVYTTLRYRPKLTADLRKVFGIDETDLSKAAPRQSRVTAPIEVSAQTGEKLYLQMGCIACHSIDGTQLGKTGPSWKGLYGAERTLTDGSTRRADETYLKASIYEPEKHKVKGFAAADTGMPSYTGILNDAQVASLLLYLKSLR